MSDYYSEQASANVSGNKNEHPNAVHSFVHSRYESVDALSADANVSGNINEQPNTVYESVDALNADFRGAVVSRPTLGQTAIGVDNSG